MLFKNNLLFDLEETTTPQSNYKMLKTVNFVVLYIIFTQKKGGGREEGSEYGRKLYISSI